MVKQTTDEMVRAEVVKSRMPTLPNERSLSMTDMILIQVSFSVATWMLVLGAWTGMATTFPLAIIACMVGCSLPLLMHSLIGPFVARWGLDNGIITNSVAGPFGTILIVLLVTTPMYIGWTSIPIVMFGRTVSESFGFLGATGVLTNAELWSFIALGIAFFILWKAAAVLKVMFRVVTPLILLLLVLMTYKIFSHYGWDQIVQTIPEGFHEDPWTSFMIAIEMNVGLGFSWPFSFAVYCRLAKTETAAFYGTWWGWGPIWAIACIPAIAGGLVAGVTDPVYLLKDIGGVWVVLYMIFLGVANIFSGICTMYIVALTARVVWPKLSWLQALSINLLVGILILIPAAYDQYGTFVAFYGALLGPLGVVWVVDILLRKMNINMKEIYDVSSRSAYYYWKGVNVPFAISCAIGTVFSLLIYNPVTCVPHIASIFNVCGAALPASLCSGLIYYVLAKVFLLPKKVGFPPIPEPGNQVVR
ncbi:MAG: cytosine permease [Desulfobacterales bacterium]|nr:cytosine permease [Desulfobacterales bacterium]